MGAIRLVEVLSLAALGFGFGMVRLWSATGSNRDLVAAIGVLVVAAVALSACVVNARRSRAARTASVTGALAERQSPAVVAAAAVLAFVVGLAASFIPGARPGPALPCIGLVAVGWWLVVERRRRDNSATNPGASMLKGDIDHR
jgi:hypothetical protein